MQLSPQSRLGSASCARSKDEGPAVGQLQGFRLSCGWKTCRATSSPGTR